VIGAPLTVRKAVITVVLLASASISLISYRNGVGVVLVACRFLLRRRRRHTTRKMPQAVATVAPAIAPACFVTLLEGGGVTGSIPVSVDTIVVTRVKTSVIFAVTNLVESGIISDEAMLMEKLLVSLKEDSEPVGMAPEDSVGESLVDGKVKENSVVALVVTGLMTSVDSVAMTVVDRTVMTEVCSAKVVDATPPRAEIVP